MIVAIAQQKGGVSKSTTAISLAVEAHGRGLRTLLVDADSQHTCLDWGEVAAAAGRTVPPVIAMAGSLHRPDQLPRVARDYDMVLVDLPARISTITASALMIADLAILPCGGTAADVWALRETLKLVNDAKELRPELVATILLTRLQTSTVTGRASRGVLEESSLPVMRTAQSWRVTYSDSLAAGMGPTDYDPRSEAADEVRRLLNEVLALGASDHGRKTKSPAKSAKAAPRRAAERGPVRRPGSGA